MNILRGQLADKAAKQALNRLLGPATREAEWGNTLSEKDTDALRDVLIKLDQLDPDLKGSEARGRAVRARRTIRAILEQRVHVQAIKFPPQSHRRTRALVSWNDADPQNTYYSPMSNESLHCAPGVPVTVLKTYNVTPDQLAAPDGRVLSPNTYIAYCRDFPPRRQSTPTQADGWMDPAGHFYPCIEWDHNRGESNQSHDILAKALTAVHYRIWIEGGKYLSDRGWLRLGYEGKVTGTDRQRCTPEQILSLEKLADVGDRRWRDVIEAFLVSE